MRVLKLFLIMLIGSAHGAQSFSAIFQSLKNKPLVQKALRNKWKVLVGTVLGNTILHIINHRIQIKLHNKDAETRQNGSSPWKEAFREAKECKYQKEHLANLAACKPNVLAKVHALFYLVLAQYLATPVGLLMLASPSLKEKLLS